MEGMGDLFNDAGIVVEAQKEDTRNCVRCYAMSFKEMIVQDPMKLFDNGYTDLKIITFSFDFNFAAKLSHKFQNVEIVVGAEFLSDKINKTIAEQTAYTLVSAVSV